MQKRNIESYSRDRRSLVEGLSVTSLLCAAGSLTAQTAPATNKPATEAEKKAAANTELKEVVVEANAQVYNPERLQSPKYTGPLRNVPQSITVVPKTVIQERGAFTLRDVLRNTPGISMQAGEGATGGAAGDLMTIRGYSAATDWFIDGVRDYGFYNRDPYNIESVEVTKGPSGANAGRGVAGGAVNLVTKTAHLGNDNQTDLTVGTDNLYRGAVDVNQQIGEHSAFRINGLYHTQDIPGRDVVEQERRGIAASLAFGLGTDTRFTLNYQHIEEDNIPDYGLPFVANGAANVGPVGATPPVSFDNYYGTRGVDFEEVQHDAFTAIFEHDFSDSVRLRNVTRYSRTYRDSLTTAPRFVTTTTNIQRNLQAYRITSEAWVNQTNLNVDFDTGPLKHALVTGLELSWERQLLSYNGLPDTSRTNLFDPTAIVGGAVNAGGRPALPPDAEGHMDTIALYLFDTVQLGKYFEINAGIRYDHVQAEGRSFGGAPSVANSDDLFSWKAALVFKPVDYGSIYFGYGTSQKASLDAVTAYGIGIPAAPPAGPGVGRLDPEETRAFELGTKWDLFEERLSLSAAVFHTQKSNSLVRNPATGDVEALGGDQYVEGIEFGFAGKLTDDWQVFGGYTWMKGRVTDNGNRPTGPLANIPESSGSLWTTYTLLEKRLQVGLGLQYLGDVHLGRTNSVVNSTTFAPAYFLVDAMVSYRFTDNFSLRLNVYNLADERYVDRSGGTVNQFVPGAGRSAALTASIKF